MEKINVALYGDGSRDAPTRAEIIQCDHCHECSFYKNKTCVRVTSFFANTDCLYGKIIREKGFTKRAMKYSSYCSEHRADPMYHQLSRPASHNVLGVIGEYVYIRIPTVEIHERHERDSNWDWSFFKLPSGKEVALHVPFGTCYPSYILKSDLEDISENGLLYKIYTKVPYTIFDHKPIKRYQTEELPYLTECLKKQLPELAEKFFAKYPTFNYEVNYVGRKVYLNTLPIGTVLKDSHSNIFTLADNETLICEDYKSYWLPFNCKRGRLEIKLTGKEIFTIEANDQVGENTKFVE